jgi:alkaline phosphatase D
MAEVDPDLPFQAHLDPDANPNMIRGVVKVTKDSDFVAKIDVTGLKGNTHYVFVFSDGTQASDVGKTRTAPGPSDNVEEFRYAVFSCS